MIMWHFSTGTLHRSAAISIEDLLIWVKSSDQPDRREAALIAQASEEATSSKKLISMLYRKHICVEIGNPLLAFLRDSQVA